MKNETFSVSGMVCYSCASILEKAVREIPGIGSVHVNYLMDTMTVSYDEQTTDSDAVSRKALHAGYRISTYSSGQDRADRLKRKRCLRNRIFLAFVCSVVLNAFGETLNVWLQLALGTVIQIIAVREFYWEAGQGVFGGKGNMSLLIAVGITCGYLYSLWVLGRGDILPCFDNMAAIVTMVLIGRFLELGVRMESVSGIRHLLDFKKQEANLITEEGEIRRIPLEKIQKGMYLLVRSGERIPVDGRITQGKLDVDESVMTGEYLPVAKHPGDVLVGGSYAVRGKARCIVDRELRENVFYGLLEEASAAMLGKKLSYIRYVDKLMEYFVPLVFGASVVTLFLWYGLWQPGDFEKAISSSLSVLLVACPCAMSLAVPTSVLHAIGGAAKHGVFIREEGKLEQLGKIHRVVFDKTGTLTTGRIRVSGFWINQPEETERMVSLLYHAEKAVQHPVAKAICAYTGEKVEKEQILCINENDGGIVAHTSDGVLYVGNRKYVEAEIGRNLELKIPFEKSDSKVFFVFNDIEGCMVLEDTVREDAFSTVQALKNMGIKVAVLSGDEKKASCVVAGQLKIPVWAGGLQPKDKERILAEWREKETLIMVGDGINDLPGMLASDISIALGSGCEAVRDCADIIIGTDRLQTLSALVLLSKKMTGNIRQNIVWALLYNVIGLIMATSGILSPVTAGFSMSLSSMVVILNAGRMKKIGNKIWENT